MNTLNVYLALAVLLITFLALNISRLRIKNQIANGDGGNKDLRKAIRAHINSLEHILPYSLLMFALNSTVVSASGYAILCFGFLTIRVGHSFSMLSSKFRLRQVASLLTYLFEVMACFTLLFSATSL